MKTIHLEATVTEDRRLIIELPPDTPLGEVHVTIQPAGELTREEIRRRLAEAGALAPLPPDLPVDAVLPTEEELDQIAHLLAGGPSTLDLINEDRGEY